MSKNGHKTLFVSLLVAGSVLILDVTFYLIHWLPGDIENAKMEKVAQPEAFQEYMKDKSKLVQSYDNLELSKEKRYSVSEGNLDLSSYDFEEITSEQFHTLYHDSKGKRIVLRSEEENENHFAAMTVCDVPLVTFKTQTPYGSTLLSSTSDFVSYYTMKEEQWEKLYAFVQDLING